MEFAFIINSHLGSKRIKKKPFLTLPIGKKGEVKALQALIYRLNKTKIPVILAVPTHERTKYEFLREIFPGLIIFTGPKSDPLNRMSLAAQKHGVENAIRVCHDKIFVEPDMVKKAVEIYKSIKVDYLFSSFFIDGTGFEIIKSSTLHMAASVNKDVEHISYAIKAITSNIYNWRIPKPRRSEHRLLIDDPPDVHVIAAIFRRFKTKTLETPCSKIVDFLNIHPEITRLNKPPALSIYTCAYNASEYIGECIASVVNQNGFKNFEYIIIDDYSTDNTVEIAERYKARYNNIKIVRNSTNLGLASSSNIALSESSGRYILRIDADDYFTNKDCLSTMLRAIRQNDHEVVYPANFFGSLEKVQQPGGDIHHIGGAIFNRRSINDIKFTDGLRGYEGLDFFERAKDLLRIGYLNTPTFFYRQHDESLTKNNLEERREIKRNILNGHN